MIFYCLHIVYIGHEKSKENYNSSKTKTRRRNVGGLFLVAHWRLELQTP